MKLASNVRAVVAGAAITGAATVVVAAVMARETGLGPAYELIPLTAFLALSWAYPVLVLRTEETEAFQLDEAFFVAMALLLPAAGTIISFATAIALGNIMRRRPAVRAAFNTGQGVTAAGLGLVAMHLLAPVRAGNPTPRSLGAAVIGAAVFMLANSVAVSVIISFVEQKRASRVFLDGLDLRALVWAGGIALGLLAAIGGAAHPWALVLGALPLAAVNLVLREHAQARRQTQRSQGLLIAAGQVHESMALGDVERAIVRSTMALVKCRKARIDDQPPGPGEVGVPVADIKANRWLVISDPIGFDPFGEPDRELLSVIAQIGAGAIGNARLLEDIRHRAIHDQVTDLPNKVLFMDRLIHALVKSPRRGRLAVLLLDLDNFKVVNNSLGHEFGDQVLTSVASRLRAALRPGDTAACLGGDEFAVLCEQVDDADDSTTMAERFRTAVSGAFTASNKVEISITASVGIVMVGPEWKLSADATLQAADTAMYRAKERGRDRIEVFDDELRSRAFHRLETENTLRRALDEGRLRVFYQPILDVASGRIVEAEALLRVETAAGTLLSPADFIEVAEGSGLIATIGVGVLEEACRQAVIWRKQFGDAAPRRIAVNLSAQQLSRVPVAETVQRVLASTGCSPQMLALEITETVLMEAGEQVRNELTLLRQMGVAIGLDDFGTGYSSLAYIKRFPLDFVKIDRCFIAGLGHDQEDDAIVDAIVNLGRSLGLSSVAEGVETVEQLAHLRSLGCDRMQGFLFARPQPAIDVSALLAGGNTWEKPHQLVLPPRF